METFCKKVHCLHQFYLTLLLYYNRSLVFLTSCNKYLDEKDTTYLELKNSFEKKNYNQRRIEKFYKKFEVNLKLRKRYNKNLKILTKEETSFQSYIYLGLLIIKLKRIDIFQKLNIILKLLDKLAVSRKKYKYYNYSLLSKLLLIEERLIKKILKS